MTGGDLLERWGGLKPKPPVVRSGELPVSKSDLAWLKARKQGMAVDRAVQALRRSA